MIFPKEFFTEEIRDDFTVPEMMKRAWAAELEVLEVIRDICARNDLKYYAYCGTLLGTIRHHGFIPWDDDIDICMLRSDYDRFFEIADQELPEGFAVSGIYGRDSRLWAANGEPQGRIIADETYFPLPVYMNRFHAFPYMRIGVDIFPLDNIPETPEEQYDLVKGVNELQKAARFLDVYTKDGSIKQRLKPYRDILDEIPHDAKNPAELSHAIWLASDRLAAGAPHTGMIVDVLYVSVPDDRSGFSGYSAMEYDWFGNGIELPFENTVMNVPTGYDEVLKWEFGSEYMTPVRFTGEHTYPFYKTQEEAFSKLLKESGVFVPVDEFCRNWHKANGYL